MGRADSDRVLGWTPMPVNDAVAPAGDTWLELSDVVEVEGGGSLEAPIEVGPD